MTALLLLGVASLSFAPAAAGAPTARLRASSLSPRLHEARDLGLARASDRHGIVVSLEPRNRELLEAFLIEVQNPASPRFQRFLTDDEFNTFFAPTAPEEEAVINHLLAFGFKLTHRSSNRLTIGAAGSVAAIEQAFGVQVHDVLFKGKRHFAAVNEPSLPTDMARYVTGILGLDDLGEMIPQVEESQLIMVSNADVGTGVYAFGPADLKTFYDGATGYTGSNKPVAIAGAYAFQVNDVKAFNSKWGLATLSYSQVCTGASGSAGCLSDATKSTEISLDVEYVHATAPASKIYNYMAASTSFADFTTMYNKIVSANVAKVVTTSWGACEATMPVATQQTNDNIFASGNAKGQSWFAASGDKGSRYCSGLTTVGFPANSPHVIGVGGTTPTCRSGMNSTNPACGGYGSEAGWSGSTGGVSQVFARPTFQVGCGVPDGTQRLVPDVAIAGDPTPAFFIYKGGAWYLVGGTSAGAPQWAGYFAQLQQKKANTAGFGNPGARLYALCGTTAYHDITSGSNTDYSAGVGYDLVTGLGSIEAKNFLAAY